jgi:hypothetical protein
VQPPPPSPLPPPHLQAAARAELAERIARASMIATPATRAAVEPSAPAPGSPAAVYAAPGVRMAPPDLEPEPDAAEPAPADGEGDGEADAPAAADGDGEGGGGGGDELPEGW